MTALLALFSPARWLMLLAAVAALVAGYFYWADHVGDVREATVNARWQDQIDKQKARAILELAAETTKTQAAERGLADFKNQREITDAKNRTTVAGLERRLRDAAGAAGRLRDPNAAGCGGGGGGAAGPDPASAVDRAGNDAPAGGLLSRELTEFLLSQAASADQINLAYQSCRADSLNLRAASSPDK